MPNNDSSTDPRRWSRRKVIGRGAGALGIGLAGCLGDGDGDGGGNGTGNGTGNGGGGGGNGGEEEFVYAFGRPPTEVQFNIFRQSNFAHSLQDQVLHYVAKGDSSGAVWPDLPDTMETDGKTLRLKFPQDYTWWNGDDLTAEDYWTYLEIRRLLNPEESKIAENVLVDDYTIERNFKTNVTPSLMRGDLTSQTFAKLTTPRSIYSKYLESLQDGGSQDARDSVRKDLQEMQIPIKQLAEEGLGNGPYEVVDWSDSETILELYEDHPLAGNTNIQTVRLLSESATENLRSLEVNNKVDMEPSGLIAESNRADYPENLQNWYELDWFRTQKITFNWENEHLAKRPVRRAIARAVNLEALVSAGVQSGLVGSAPELQTGLRSSIHEKYLGEGWVDQLIDYPASSDVEGATKLMEDAGYSKSGGTWQDGSGNPVTFSFLTSNGTFQSSLGVVFSDQMESFGFNMDVTTVGETDFYQTLQNYDHDMWWVWHVAAALWHPTSYFSNDFYGLEVGDPSSDSETGVTGIPFELAIPSEVGAREISGNGETINPAQLMEDLPVAESEDQVREMSRTLVQWTNFDLPILMWIEELSGSWGDVEAYSFPSPDDEGVKLNMDRPGETAITHCWINRVE